MIDVDSYFDHPLLKLSGGTITFGSLLLGVTLLVATFLMAGLAGRWVRTLLERRGTPTGTQAAEAKIVTYAVAVLGVMVAFDAAGLRLGALLAASTVLAVGIGFGLQNVAQNFISGLILLVEQPVRQGDIIRFNDRVGVVENIGLRATHMVTNDGVTLVVPNSEFISKALINHSRPLPQLRITINVGVAYGSSVQDVRDTLIAVAAAHPAVLPSPPPEVRFEAFGDSSLSFAVLCWVPSADPDVDARIASDLREGIDAAFRARGIEIPFPQRDVHMR